MSEWFCQVCNKDLKNRDRYETHISDDHVPCGEPGCTFSGPEFVLAAHRLKHTKAADGKSVVDSPEELRAWIKRRKANWPSRDNMQRKAEDEQRRRHLGALPDNAPDIGMLEKLLRSAHGLDDRWGQGGWGNAGYGSYSKSYGGPWGKGYGKGKGKGMGKGKGKGKKGKDKFKGKDKGSKDKGKAKGKGKGMKGWLGWDDGVWVGTGGGSHSGEHQSASLPLPSVLANCVPLEAPFGTQWQPSTVGREGGKRGLCRFFERGFCYHGERCQYEHASSSRDVNRARGLSGGTTSNTAEQHLWWVLPSTLANRACGPGEGPAGADAARHGSRLRALYVEPCHRPDERERRDGLLRRLLRPEIHKYYSAILQCVRYIVATDFFRLERIPLPDSITALEGPGIRLSLCDEDPPLAPNAQATLALGRVEVGEDLEDADIAELADVLAV